MDRPEILELKELYNKLSRDIDKRLDEFKNTGQNGSETDVFIELVFCLLTPQSKAKYCWAAVEKLIAEDLIFNGSWEEISGHLNYVRFKNNKSKYLVDARCILNGTPLTKKIKSFWDYKSSLANFSLWFPGQLQFGLIQIVQVLIRYGPIPTRPLLPPVPNGML